MPSEVNYDLASAKTGTADTVVEERLPSTRQLDDAVTDETFYINSKFPTYMGFYRNIPECKIAVDTMARWVIGDGFMTDDSNVAVVLDSIKGWGRDTFDDILENQWRMALINGDSFAEIIKDEDDNLINLKPLDAGSMKIIVNAKGMVKRYEQTKKVADNKEQITKFDKGEIFHLSNNRIGSEIHGISMYEALENVIKASNESFEIEREIIRNFSRPKLMIGLKTNDKSKRDDFIAEFDTTTNKGNNLFFPLGTVEPQVLAIPPNSTINVISWRDHVRNYFYQVVGIPQILMGGASEFTESTAKIALVSFSQTVKQVQRYIITQVWQQLFIRIDLDPPVSLKNELITDEKKDGRNADTALRPSDFDPMSGHEATDLEVQNAVG